MEWHETYVSLETAKLLKQAGFNWEVKTYYHYLSPYDEYNLEFDSISTNYNHLNNADFSAPTLEVAQRWLREKKNHHVCVSFVFANNHKYYAFVSRPSDKGHLECECGWIENEFNTYEEAQEAGIKKALEIILEKGE